MSGRRKWSDIRGPRTPEQEARIAAGAAAIRMGQRLDSVRTGRGVTQTVSARDDVYLSTLISYVRTLGGDLRIEAIFPDEDPVAITLGTASPEQKPAATSAPA